MIKENAMLALGTIDWYSNYNQNIAIAKYSANYCLDQTIAYMLPSK
jgi:hypothetical protein